jgi:hypothetical protein
MMLFTKRTKRLQSKSGQAIVEYVLVMSVFVVLTAWGLNMLKCSLHRIWIQMACEVLYPYPNSEANNIQENKDYCSPIEDDCIPSI